MFDLNERDFFFIPIITAMVNMLKALGLKNKFAPLVSLLLGLCFSIIFSVEVQIKYRILKGIILGLSASGFYTSGKKVISTVKKNNNDHE